MAELDGLEAYVRFEQKSDGQLWSWMPRWLVFADPQMRGKTLADADDPRLKDMAFEEVEVPLFLPEEVG